MERKCEMHVHARLGRQRAFLPKFLFANTVYLGPENHDIIKKTNRFNLTELLVEQSREIAIRVPTPKGNNSSNTSNVF